MSLTPLLGPNGPVPFVGEREVLSRHGLTLNFTIPYVLTPFPFANLNLAGCMLKTPTLPSSVPATSGIVHREHHPSYRMYLHLNGASGICNSACTFERSTGEKVTPTGTLFLSSVRMVFVADQPSQSFTALDIPLVYLRSEKFNQPIFGANNLTGMVFSVADGGPSSETPPWEFTFYFKEGGCGTFLPLFFSILEAIRSAPPEAQVPEAPTAPAAEEAVRTAYMDPNDPTRVYVVQPATERRIDTQGYPTLFQRTGMAMMMASSALL